MVISVFSTNDLILIVENYSRKKEKRNRMSVPEQENSPCPIAYLLDPFASFEKVENWPISPKCFKDRNI